MWAHNMMEYYQNHVKDIQIEIIPYDRRRTKNGLLFRILGGILDYRKAIIETKRKLNNDNYDVLHICTSASISLVKDIIVLKVAKKRSVKTAVHLHFGRVPELVRKRNWEWRLLKKVIGLADAVVTMDMKSYEALRGLGYSNIHYLPNPLSQDIMRQISDEASSVERDVKKLCFVGHVIPSKGVYEMVEACKQIDGIKLNVIGKVAPEVRSRMEEIAGNSDWLTFKGELSHQCVIREMLSSGIFLLPSYTEGFPNVILESMACRCAIVATSVGAIPEMLNISSDLPCGLCSEPKDVDNLHNNILFFMNHPTEARQFAERAERRVNDYYAMSIIWKQIHDIWNVLLTQMDNK